MNVNFEPIIRGLKVIFLRETKCKICFIYVGVNCKKTDIVQVYFVKNLHVLEANEGSSD